MNMLRILVGTLVFFVTLPLLYIGDILRKRDVREYGLSYEDRNYEIRRKFGDSNMALAHSILRNVIEPTDQVFGAIIFLSNNVDQLSDLVELANTNRGQLLNAATVKEERG